MQSADAQLTSYHQPGEAEFLATVGGHDFVKRSGYFTESCFTGVSFV